MNELIRAYPAAAPVLGPSMVKNLDWPDADDIAGKLEALASGGGDPEAAKQTADLAKQVQDLTMQLQAEQMDKSIESRKLDIEAYKAETDRAETQWKLEDQRRRALVGGTPSSQASN
jgi:hypothetical protein